MPKRTRIMFMRGEERVGQPSPSKHSASYLLLMYCVSSNSFSAMAWRTASSPFFRPGHVKAVQRQHTEPLGQCPALLASKLQLNVVWCRTKRLTAKGIAALTLSLGVP